MSLERCIPDLVKEGRLTAEQGAAAAELYGRRKRFHRRSMGDAAAEALASDETAAALERSAAQSRRQKQLQMKAQLDAITNIAKFDGGSGKSPGDAAIALLVRDERAPYSNVEYRWKEVRGSAHALIDGILLKHRRNLVGQVRSKAELEDLVREAFGQKTSNLSAREFADAWAQASEMLRQRFNAAGGDIGKLDSWGLPQSHDSVVIAEASKAEWVDYITPLLDRPRMIDDATGKPFDDETLSEVLGDVYDTIRTDGQIDRVPGGQRGGKLANQRADHRFLHFADADSWLQYQARFGKGTAFDAMMNHIDGMSRDIALMETLGPNPAATVQWLQDSLTKQAAIEGGRGDRRLFGLRPGKLRTDLARQDVNIVGEIFDEIMGKYRAPHNRELALTFSAIRSWQVSTKLGSAVLSTTSDQATQILTRGFNGLPIRQMASSQVKLLNPLDSTHKAFAIREGLIAEEASQIASAQARYTGEELTGEISRNIAETVMRVSGLNAVTQAGRWSFGMDFISALTDYAPQGWDALEAPFRRMLERYGLDAADWDKIRA
ncbi:hypothetical protein, partial [Sphingomonas sp. LaA6.9]|uniref:hypothetical protein n=1 Tax=Sphingomonas sp. LaA6.9 TaxID=2919914 RepID=UPI001F503644